jgi:hypothetical protein
MQTRNVENADTLVLPAAVPKYRPSQPSAEKMARFQEPSEKLSDLCYPRLTAIISNLGNEYVPCGREFSVGEKQFLPWNSCRPTARSIQVQVGEARPSRAGREMRRQRLGLKLATS